jgi:hypothetical protein
MWDPYPSALRMRLIDFVEAGGSRREAAEQFDVSVGSAIRWLQHFRNDGSISAETASIMSLFSVSSTFATCAAAIEKITIWSVRTWP